MRAFSYDEAAAGLASETALADQIMRMTASLNTALAEAATKGIAVSIEIREYKAMGGCDRIQVEPTLYKPLTV